MQQLRQLKEQSHGEESKHNETRDRDRLENGRILEKDQPTSQRGFYYLAQLKDDGSMDQPSDPTKQLRVEKGAEVRFKLRRGAAISRDCTLLVNKPMVITGEDETGGVYGSVRGSPGEVQYTVTQPKLKKKLRQNIQGQLEEMKDGTPRQRDEYQHMLEEADIDPKTQYLGSTLEKDYLERVLPYEGDSRVNIEFRVHFPDAGAFFVQIEYLDLDLQELNYTDPIYLNVDPVLIFEDSQREVRCKELSMLTVLSRCLGPLSSWESAYEQAAQLGYSALHFTPFQQYGESYSHYSLADQNNIDPYFFADCDRDETLKPEDRARMLREKVSYCKNEYGVFGIVDIVLNHTANNSRWLLNHPEAAYNTRDCPHLNSAYILDRALADFSDDFAARKKDVVDCCPSAPYLNNEGDLGAVMNAIQNKVFSRLNLHEFFLIDVDKTIESLRKAMRSLLQNHSQLDRFRQLHDRRKHWTKDRYTLLTEDWVTLRGADRMTTSLSMELAASYFYIGCGNSEEAACQQVRALLIRHNEEWRKKVGEWQKEALGNLEGEIRYFKLQLRNTHITSGFSGANRLTKRYFSELPNEEGSRVAHNGWIMNAKALEDFALTGWHYLRRTINIWGDSVKLRYGDCPADSPYLWEHMTRYVQAMAGIFDGFRLDNAHSTPIHVCNYLLQQARCANRNLFVMAELFTASAEADALFVTRLNLNGLIREIQNSSDARQLGAFFHKSGGCQEAVLGLIDQEFTEVTSTDNGNERYRVLLATTPKDIMYDCTHDNPSPLEKFKTARIALSHLGVAAMADIPIASTWGYDQLIPKNIDVVKEKRLYFKFDQSNLFDGQEPRSARASPDRQRLDHSDQLEYQHHSFPESQFQAQQVHRFFDNHQVSLLDKPQQAAHDFDYTFTFTSSSAKRVRIAGTFTGWAPQYDLNKQGHEQWSLKLTLPRIQGEERVLFKFVIDENNWQVNHGLSKTKDSSGNENNYVDVPKLGENSSQMEAYRAENLNSQGKHQWEAATSFSGPEESQYPDIRYARRKLNAIHQECTRENAGIFLHQQSDDVIVIIRQFSLDYKADYDAYVSITRHPYYLEGGDYSYQTTIELPGLFAGVSFCGYLEINSALDHREVDSDPKFIKGSQARLKVFKNINQFCKVERIDGGRDKLVFWKMPPSFTCVVRTRYPQNQKDAVKFLNDLRENVSLKDLSRQLFSNTSVSAFNHILFRCDSEEKEISNGSRGPYGLQKYGQFKYAGITSFMTIYRALKVSGDMSHELFNNMREGDWYLDYSLERLSSVQTPTLFKDELVKVVDYLKTCLDRVKTLSKPLRPKYGSRVIERLYDAAIYEITQKRMTDDFIRVNADDLFVQKLALGCIQMYGRVPSAMFYNHKDTMAAGLPHFSTGYMRSWGRDTFIALKGLMLTTGLWEESEDIIVQFARVIRHGLVPNLHDRGNNTRFNARDSTWFFLQAIKDYYLEKCSAMRDNESAVRFLTQNPIELHFKDKDQAAHSRKQHEKPVKITLARLMHHILQEHSQGIKFREWNAGTQIDGQMRSEGFDVEIRLDKQTGFMHGGNAHNCGTWMDKMGSAPQNKGQPATSRDGAPIELVAMQYSVLRFMQDLADDGIIDTHIVSLENGEEWTYKHWADRIQENFERCFWVPLTREEDPNFDIKANLVNRRGIYKDVYRPSQAYTEYQLRPNLCVAMSYAPELFKPDRARQCLQTVEVVLLEKGCMGMKTLDPSDKNYRGDYINSDDSHGWNYHQGPEWLWPLGFFLKAKKAFGLYNFREEAKDDIMKWLLPHQEHLLKFSQWEGLPELTNSHGKVCPDSCPTQAWSFATILDALKDLYTS